MNQKPRTQFLRAYLEPLNDLKSDFEIQFDLTVFKLGSIFSVNLKASTLFHEFESVSSIDSIRWRKSKILILIGTFQKRNFPYKCCFFIIFMKRIIKFELIIKFIINKYTYETYVFR